jgi:DNA-binding ferritin-like protein
MKSSSIFPQNMLTASELSIESIASKLTHFHIQLHLIHWQTQGYAEHICLGNLYDYVHDFKDELVEKLMGYAGRRITGIDIKPVVATSSVSVVTELISFAAQLKQYAESNGYNDVSNMADSLSGEAAKIKYLLTLS